MKITIEYPVDAADVDLLSSGGVTRVAQHADELGYDAICFTEHPAPSREWLKSDIGHETFDVTSALAFCAAVTARIRLMTYLVVLPYHNAFLAAKALATVDRLSDGRLTVVAGSGYSLQEYETLGVDFATRNARFAEALEVMRMAWSGDSFTYDGDYFSGRDIMHRPTPVQGQAVPVLIGGNSPLARRRAARNQGWSPLLVPDDFATAIRTSSLSMGQLAEAVSEVRADGSGKPLEVQVMHPVHTHVLRGSVSSAEHAEHLAQLREAGVDSMVLRLPRDSVRSALLGLEVYASRFRS